MDIPARIVSGLTQSANALFVAAAAQARPHGVVLYVVPSDGDLEQSVADVAFFLAALEGLPVTAAERAVLAFPSHEVDPYRGLAPHVGVTSARARIRRRHGRDLPHLRPLDPAIDRAGRSDCHRAAARRALRRPFRHAVLLSLARKNRADDRVGARRSRRLGGEAARTGAAQLR